jgi:putative flippase GtrA
MNLNLKKEHKQFFRSLLLYGVFGGIAALVDFSVFYALAQGAGINKFVANIISMHAGMVVSFALNRNFNFKKRDKLARRFFIYYAVILVGMALSSFLLWVLGLWLPSKAVVKAITILIVSGLQFIVNKYVTFQH